MPAAPLPDDDAAGRGDAPGAQPPAPGGECPARRMMLDPGGPALVEGPVEVQLPDGSIARSDRFMVAVCMCRRSRTYPWCDTSHRRRSRPPGPGPDGTSAGR